jgi:hypothetical protein
MRSSGTKVAGSGGVQSKKAFESDCMDFFKTGTEGTAPEGTGPFEIEVAVVSFVLRDIDD